MQHFTKALLFLILFFNSSSSFSQKKTINFPPFSEILNAKNKEIFLNRIDSTNFYGEIFNGKIVAITARNSNNNNNIQLHYNIIAKDDDQTSGSKCVVCRCVLDKDGGCLEGSKQCYEFDCADLTDLNLRLNTIDTISRNSYPIKRVTGSYSIYKKVEYEIFAIYFKGKVINYTVKSFKGSKTNLQWGTITSISRANNSTKKCWIEIISVDRDGNRSIKTIPVPCDKVPFPSGGRTK
jgi:hypothetical protein